MNIDYSLLVQLLCGIAGGADDPVEAAHFGAIDIESDDQQKALIADVLVPAFNQLPTRLREAVLAELERALSLPDVKWSQLFDAALSPVHPPRDAGRFFARLADHLQGREGTSRAVNF